MRGGNRNMYYATGLPGWMRLGYSPGWVGRSPDGLPPTAQYLQTGTWPTPQSQAQWQGMQTGTPSSLENQEISTLKTQVVMLEKQLELIKNKLEEMKQ